MQFEHLRSQSSQFGEHKDCTVKLVALALRTSYADAWNLCKAAGRKPRTGMFPHEYHPILIRHGLTLTRISHPARSVKALEAYKLRGRYIVSTSRHVLYYEDGQAQDWTTDKQNHIEAIYKIDGEAVGTNPDCSTLNTNATEARLLLKPKRTRKTGVCWKMIRCDTGDTLCTYKRKPTKQISSLARGGYLPSLGPQVKIAIVPA
jgi:hypothetical protein